MTLFDWLNEITYHKRPWETFTDDDKAEFNIYMINRFVSMDENYIGLINHIQKYPNVSKKSMYKFYCFALPTKKTFFKYIKSNIKEDSETVKAIAKYYQCSRREAREYVNLVDTQNIKNELNMGMSSTNKKRRKKS